MKGFEAMVVKATARTGHAKTESTESPNRFILVKDKLVALFYSNKLNFQFIACIITQLQRINRPSDDASSIQMIGLVS